MYIFCPHDVTVCILLQWAAGSGISSAQQSTAQLSLVWYSRINGIQTVQLDGAHLDQTLPQHRHPAPHCWVLSPWKPYHSQGWCKRLVFVRKLDAWRRVFCCCFLKSAGLWKGLFVADLHVKAPLRPVFPTTQWNKPLRQLNLEKLPSARPHILGCVTVCLSVSAYRHSA